MFGVGEGWQCEWAMTRTSLWRTGNHKWGIDYSYYLELRPRSPHMICIIVYTCEGLGLPQLFDRLILNLEQLQIFLGSSLLFRLKCHHFYPRVIVDPRIVHCKTLKGSKWSRKSRGNMEAFRPGFRSQPLNTVNTVQIEFGRSWFIP